MTSRGMAATVNQTRQTFEHYRLHADVCRVLTDPKRLMLIAKMAPSAPRVT